MKITEIKWWDSQMYLYQQSLGDTFEPITITSVGYLLANDSKHESYTLVGDWLGTDGRRILTIPKENVISVKTLK